MTAAIDKRRWRRVEPTEYIAHFTENNLAYASIIEDISINGLRVSICRINSQITAGNKISWFQASLIRHTTKYDIVISDSLDSMNYKQAVCPNRKKKFYKLTVCPRWRKNNGNFMTIGFDIIEPSSEWKIFSQHVLPKKKVMGQSTDSGCQIMQQPIEIALAGRPAQKDKTRCHHETGESRNN